MLREEADWIRQAVDSIAKENSVYPMANVGSSDYKFDHFEPWIAELTDHLTSNGQVMNIDMKESPTVDLVGDLLDAKFIQELSGYQFKCFICANILTNITDRHSFADSISSIVPAGGHLIATVSHRYPYVADPVDTGYRPRPEELADLFKGFELLDAQIIESASFMKLLWRNKKMFFLMWARMCVPFYKPKTWWNLVKYTPHLFKPVSASCALMVKSNG